MRPAHLFLALPLLAPLGCAYEGPHTATRAWFDCSIRGQPEFVCDRIDVRPAQAHRVATFRWSHLHDPCMPGPFVPPQVEYVDAAQPAPPPSHPAMSVPGEPLPPLPYNEDAHRDPAPPRTSWLFETPTTFR